MGDDRQYWVAFNRITGIGAVRLRGLLEHFDNLEEAWNAPSQELRAAGLGPQTVEALVAARRGMDPAEELQRVERLRARVVTWEDAEYPPRLKEIAAPPPVLYVRGSIDAVDEVAVAIVGTRRPTAYGQQVARQIGGELAAAGLTVISGLARGVDAIAHRAALDAGGRTLAVLGSGIDVIYPPEHRSLAAAIVESGALVTDYCVGRQPEAVNFPARNRIISGLALAVVVVEAGATSGALLTADFAAEQGREVLAVPGSIYNRASAGCNRLIQNGARPLLAAIDVVEALDLEVTLRQSDARQHLPEDSVERQVMGTLSQDPTHVDDVAARCGLPVSQVSACLTMLELKGRARQVGGMSFVAVNEPRPVYRVE
jgi:DNA processing protein